MKRAVNKKVRAILRQLERQGLTIATAESCTGGGIVAVLTSVSGSSAFVKGGIVAYWNETKNTLLHVHKHTLSRYGVVSEPVVREMAFGALRALHADVAVSTSGVTGPTGGTPDNPVCTVWMAVAWADGRCQTFRMSETDDGRARNAEKAIEKALDLVLKSLEKVEN